MLFVIKKSLRVYIEYALLAQLVEHLTLNQGVQGSSPWRRSIKYRFCGRRSHGVGAFFLLYGRKDSWYPDSGKEKRAEG